MDTNMDLFNLEDIDFDLDPIFVIQLENKESKWYLERIEFSVTDKLIREIYWTPVAVQAIHFHDYDDVLSFASTQFNGRRVSVKELI